jgi:hypothetical protein
VTIALGLAILAKHYAWARWLLARLKKTAKTLIPNTPGRAATRPDGGQGAQRDVTQPGPSPESKAQRTNAAKGLLLALLPAVVLLRSTL